MIYKEDCRFFRGDIPCKHNKSYGVHCEDCKYYKRSDGKILIIKLGAIGDVIRTTPLLHGFEKEFPNYEIWWLTLTPDVLPSSIDKILQFNLENILWLKELHFDWLINLDKDPHACSLALSISANKKSGFILKNGKPAPIDNIAEHKFYTGIFDDYSKNNTKSYLEEIFEILGWEFNGEEYILEKSNNYSFEIPNNGAKIIGLNTGCGARWSSRLWSEDNWAELIRLIQNHGYFPLLLGGEAEDKRNLSLHKRTNASYLGYFPLQKFISLLSNVDLLVTGVTMALHLGIGLKKKIVLFNNIFNPNEFELYGRGVIVQPEKECKCYFQPKCINPEYFCMDYIYPEVVFNEIEKVLKS